MSGLLARRERDRGGALTVLTYHRVLPEERCARYPFPSLAMPLGAFREQVRWLAAHGEVASLAQALELDAARARRPAFALTFDDGYDDSSEIVAGILEEAGLRGTFFVTTGFVGTGDLLWFDRAALLFAEVGDRDRRAIVRQACGDRRAGELPPPEADGASWTRHLKGLLPGERAAVLAELERAAGGAPAADGYRSMSVAQVTELHRRGHEVGSHTVSHAMLPDLDEAALRREIEAARDTIAGWTGGTVPGFCYPNGDHDERTVAAVVRAGHAYACTTRDGVHGPRDDRYRIPRVDVAPGRVTSAAGRPDTTAFRRELCGLYGRRGRAPAIRGAR